MDELICRVLNGQASKADEAELFAWRRRSFNNERHYRNVVEMLDHISSASREQQVDPPPLIEDLIERRPASEKGSRTPHRTWWQITATALAAAATLFLVIYRGGSSEDAVFGAGEVVTGASESTTVRLGDGSIVRLGPRSRLRVTADQGAREVWMEGRAYFAVARDESRPFRIRTHAGDAVVLGTRFDLEARQDDMRVMVVEGAVRMGTAQSEMNVAANEVGTLGNGGMAERRTVEVEELERELAWVGNFIAFENTPLSTAAEELSRRFDVPVVILDSLVARETVRATFTDESLEEITRVLCRTVTVHCSVQDGKVTIGL